MKLPHILRYSDSAKGGKQKAFVITINPKYKNDKGLFAHEYEHLKQWYFLLVIIGLIVYGGLFYVHYVFSYFVAVPLVAHNLFYRFKPYRKWSEAKAFKAQLKHYNGKHFDWAVSALVNDYNLNITRSEAEKLLR